MQLGSESRLVSCDRLLSSAVSLTRQRSRAFAVDGGDAQELVCIIPCWHGSCKLIVREVQNASDSVSQTCVCTQVPVTPQCTLHFGGACPDVSRALQVQPPPTELLACTAHSFKSSKPRTWPGSLCPWDGRRGEDIVRVCRSRAHTHTYTHTHTLGHDLRIRHLL